ncbi:Cys-tRNA(Pro) deacylase [Parolsenella catena]|uniref:Cys-tRNA(Pro) deacylase n=1 Tax=Parolsenella catena TaxID=2003188 RepID=UPI00319D94A6
MARKQRVQKTNAMRELERGGVAYEAIEFDEPDPTGVSDLGVRIANMLGYDPAQGFKTLVCVAPHGGHVVCCIPSGDELDLKKAAAAAGEKSLTLMHVRDLEPTTGYVRGGCSPVGMKKQFPTLIDETAQLFDDIYISGGRLGLTLRLAPDELAAFLDATLADICRN